MKTLIALVIAFGAACAHVDPPKDHYLIAQPSSDLCLAVDTSTGACVAHGPSTETIAYNPPLAIMGEMRGGVPIVDGSIYNGLQSMPEVVLKTAATTQMSTAKIAPFTPLTGSQQTDKYVQFVSVTNLDTSAAICLYLETPSQTCASSVAFTCLGASLQGMVTPAGTSRDFRVTGLLQVCATASEANADAQLERTVMYAR